jgi:hypothetical protein
LSRSSRGVSGDDPEGGARCGVPRLRLVTAGSGRHGNPPARHYDLRREELRCTSCGGNAADGSADPEPKNRHGGAPKGARPTLLDAGGLASARTCRVMVRPTGCRCTRAPVGAPPTPRVGNQFKTRVQSRRGNVKSCSHGLFDNVRWMNVQADLRMESASFAATGGGGRVGA